MGATVRHMDDERLLMRYLLGELPEQERDRLQSAYFADAGLFARLLAAEDDLIDAYVRGTLTNGERKRFEERFRLTGAQLQRLKFAPMLQEAAGRPSRESGASVWRAPAIAAAIVSAIVGLSWWVVSHDVEPVPQTVAAVRRTVAPPVRTPLETIASVVLRPGLVRESGTTAQLVLADNTTSAQIRVELAPDLPLGDYSSYQAVVETAAGAEVIRHRKLAIEGQFISVNVPANLLTHKDYVVMLSGERADGTQQFLRGYSFTVSR